MWRSGCGSVVENIGFDHWHLNKKEYQCIAFPVSCELWAIKDIIKIYSRGKKAHTEAFYSAVLLRACLLRTYCYSV